MMILETSSTVLLLIVFVRGSDGAANQLCPKLEDPTNGRVSRCKNSGCPVGSYVSFSCDPGYILRGNSFLACKQSQNTFIWSSHPPQCELDPGYCAKLTQPPDSYSMSCTKSACPVGTIVLLGCKENFEPVRSSVIMCTRPSSDPAEWTSTPLCIPLTEESGRSRNSGKLRRKLSELDNKPN